MSEKTVTIGEFTYRHDGKDWWTEDGEDGIHAILSKALDRIAELEAKNKELEAEIQSLRDELDLTGRWVRYE